MESTGVYWKPIYNLFEGEFEVILVNAQHLKAVPGRKTDVKDSEWIADLLQHGLVRGSFIAPRPIRELRDLTRHRTRLIQQRASVANRVAKVLEDANIKLKSVVSDMQGKTALAIVEALTRGEKEPAVFAELARGQLKSKKEELRQALAGRVTEHHQFLLRELVDQLRYLEGAIQRASEEIQRRMGPFEGAALIWDWIPGIDRVAAENLVAEIGVNVSQFPTAGHLSSWVGMCPGQNESTGRQHSGKTRKGSPWLGRTLTQAAWAASRTKNSYFKAQYQRMAGRRGRKRAIVAVGHSLLVVAYHLLKNG
jgi:transposase